MRPLIKSVLYILVCAWIAAFGLVAAAIEWVTMGESWRGWVLADFSYAVLFILMLIDKVRDISFTPPPKWPMMTSVTDASIPDLQPSDCVRLNRAIKTKNRAKSTW